MEPQNEDELFLAGERVPPGRYRRLDSSVEIVLENEDYLPASLDGHVACYTCVRSTWSLMQPSQTEHPFRRADTCLQR